jgi:hypothetical protein
MDTLSEHEIDVDDAEAGVCTAEPANLELDQFLVERRMRPIICRDVHPQPDHSSFDKEARQRSRVSVLHESADSDPQLCAHVFNFYRDFRSDA